MSSSVTFEGTVMVHTQLSMKTEAADLAKEETLGWALRSTDTMVRAMLRRSSDRPEAVYLGNVVNRPDANGSVPWSQVLPLAIRSKAASLQLLVGGNTSRDRHGDFQNVIARLTMKAGEMPSAVVGARFRGPEASRRVMVLPIGAPLDLKPEPSNPHDRLAVAAFSNGLCVGYIPKTDNPLVAFMLGNKRFKLRCRVVTPGATPRINIKWEIAE